MEERNEIDRVDEVMLPGFRFHPTDEELVGFYLKRKIQQKPLSIELIRQLDIYKYDPWDLPKLATSGEKEWYFYCPRDRKYRNSARPNRVTGAGFWKATGTDRPIYSSEGTTKYCIGLKKSLVFYRGRAAKGVKTDWMMHEYRLPSPTDSSSINMVCKRPLDKNIPTNEAWAICRIFKKANSVAQRANPSHSWVSPLPPETTDVVDVFSVNLRCPQSAGSAGNNALQQQQQPPAISSFPSFIDVGPYRSTSKPSTINNIPTATASELVPTCFVFSSPPDHDQVLHGALSKNCTVDVASLLQAMPPSSLGNTGKNSSSSSSSSSHFSQQCHGFTTSTVDLPPLDQMMSASCMRSTATANGSGEEHHMGMRKHNDLNAASQIMNSINQWGTLRSAAVTFPLGLSPNLISDAWSRPNQLTWDSILPTCPNETSTTALHE